MGRTVPTYRMHLESILDSWMDYRRALREKDREVFDELTLKARQHASAASYCAHLDPTTTAFLSILLEFQKELQNAKSIHMDMHTQSDMARNIAVADDVYEILSREKRDGESFSDVLRRWRPQKGSLLDCYGLWGDIPEEEFRNIEAAIYGADRPASEELRRRKAGK